VHLTRGQWLRGAGALPVFKSNDHGSWAGSQDFVCVADRGASNARLLLYAVLLLERRTQSSHDRLTQQRKSRAYAVGRAPVASARGRVIAKRSN
jgi:hypothetical protein